MNGALEFLKALGPARLAAMGVVSALLIGFFGFVTMKVSQPAMTPLYSDLAARDSAAIVRELEAQGVPYELRQDGTQILVPKEGMLRLRMRLAEKGIPAGGSVGYEIFDKSDTLGTTSFVQNINHIRALEGELARTIQAIDRVQAARVHLVIPERQLFQREKVEPSASIVLKIRGGSLEPAQIRSIQHLVASAVQGLKAGRVSVVDEQGTLLAGGQEDDPTAAVAAGLQERTTSFERRLETQIESIIASVVGQGRTRVRVSAELDFSRVTQTSDTYDPNGQVVRSTQTKEESNNAQNVDKGVTVGTQVPGQQGQGQGQGQGGDQRRENSNSTEELINYEISKTSRTEIQEAGRIKRVSVAVLVDGIYAPGTNGEVNYQPRSQEDIDRIATLVRSAVGFDQKRGDLVEVVNLRFAEAPASLPLDTQAKSGWMAMLDFTKDDIMRFAELGVLLLMTLLVLLVAVRPLMKRMFGPSEAAGGVASAVVGPDGKTLHISLPVTVGADGKPMVGSTEEEKAAAAGEGGEGNALGAAIAGAIEDASQNPMQGKIEQAKHAGAMQANSIARVGEMINEFPNEAVAIIRGWLNDGS